MSAVAERAAPYLRPNQVEQLVGEKAAIEGMLQAPEYIRNQIQDKGSMLRQVRSIDSMLHKDAPPPLIESERDDAVRSEQELRDELTSGMPTQAEMRRAPPGAIDKLRTWETRNKAKILRWKNLRLRMHAAGMLDSIASATDVANLERYRPHGGAQELNMDNALVQAKGVFLPNGPIAARNVMSEEDRAAMLQRDAELAATVAKATVDRLLEIQATAPPPAKPGRAQ
ncbi:MAG: hypothetical protein AB7I42_26060 [Bradyrhizobium sp.]|uniref:hypothetical protein n=1 Tax=Bradyrhizobium sp. TaxID=376 RepID=UPI003D0EDD2A